MMMDKKYLGRMKIQKMNKKMLFIWMNKKLYTKIVMNGEMMMIQIRKLKQIWMICKLIHQKIKKNKTMMNYQMK